MPRNHWNRSGNGRKIHELVSRTSAPNPAAAIATNTRRGWRAELPSAYKCRS
jgi:hypothetical protein